MTATRFFARQKGDGAQGGPRVSQSYSPIQPTSRGTSSERERERERESVFLVVPYSKLGRGHHPRNRPPKSMLALGPPGLERGYGQTPTPRSCPALQASRTVIRPALQEQLKRAGVLQACPARYLSSITHWPRRGRPALRFHAANAASCLARSLKPATIYQPCPRTPSTVSVLHPYSIHRLRTLHGYHI